MCKTIQIVWKKNNAKQIQSVMYGSNNAETDRIP